MKKHGLYLAAILFFVFISACSSKDDSALPLIRMLDYHDAYYEVINDKAQLEKSGIFLDDDACGRHTAWLAENHDGYEVSDHQTETELLAYGDTDQEAVMIINEKGTVSAAVFAGYIAKDTDASYAFSQLFSFYGIHDSKDIVSVYETDWNRSNIKGDTITDPGQISILYRLLCNAEAYGNDSFQQIRFGDIGEEKQPQAHTEFADDLHEICMVTKDGIRLYAGFFPKSGWINGYGSMSWYRMTDEMTDWYNENIR